MAEQDELIKLLRDALAALLSDIDDTGLLVADDRVEAHIAQARGVVARAS